MNENINALNYNEEFIFKQFQYHPEFNLKYTISLLLQWIKLSQNKDSRKLFYLGLAHLFSVNTLSERAFRVITKNHWPFWIFFVTKDLTMFFRMMESYNQGICFFEFDAPMWYSKKREHFNTLIIPYSEYYLRINSYALYNLWYHMEAVRRTKYNEVIKGHFYSCAKSRIKNVMLIRGNMSKIARGWYQALWRKRWYDNLANKYFIFFRHGHNSNLTDYMKVDFNKAPFIYNQKELNVTKAYFNKTPKIVKDDVLYEIMTWRYILIANYLVTHFADYYSAFGRYDFPVIQILLWIFTFKNYYINYFYKMMTAVILEEFFSEMVDKEDHSNYSIISELYQLKDDIPYHVTYLLSKFHKDIEISYNYDMEWIRRLLTRYRFTTEEAFEDSVRYLWWSDRNREFLLPHYSHIFYGMDNFYTLTIPPLTIPYWMWRDYSRNGEEYRLDEARIPSHFLFQTLHIEYFMTGEEVGLWTLYMFILRNQKLLFWSDTHRQIRNLQKNPRYDVKSKDYVFNKSEELRPLIFPILKLSDFVYYKTVKDMHYIILNQSETFAFLSHFVVFKDKQKEIFDIYSWQHTRLWTNIPIIFFSWDRFRKIYKNVLAPKYRRYLSRRALMSKNDPELREVWWDVYYHKMRRAGIKVPDELPYYSASDEDDYVKDLTDIKKKEGYDIYFNDIWQIDSTR